VFQKVLIANRGEIACRVVRTLRRLGVRSVAVYSEADAHAAHVAQADEAVLVGPPAAAESYLNRVRILDAAKATGAQAIHPGYGFLSENTTFARECEEAGIVFLGPTAEQMQSFGLKHTAREKAIECAVPLLPGSGLLADVDEARREAQRLRYPVMLKSTAGGGGIGMRLCRTEAELAEAFAAVQHLGRANFGDAGLYVERFVENARHIEVQIFGDGRGKVLALGERDCSVQRRNQKVVEETPAQNIADELRAQLYDAAVRLGRAVSYRSAGTVEFILDADAHEFYFLEVNTRLQVEHGVTEAVTGIDLVEWMVRLGCGELGPLSELAPNRRGASIQVRVYAENPARNFQPSVGLLTAVQFPADVRCDTWVAPGTEVTSYYDPLLAKLVVYGPDRDDAIRKMQSAIETTVLAGVENNLEYLQQIFADERFRAGAVTTKLLQSFNYQPRTIDVLDGGTQTTIQDWPGRVGYWAVGVPPSGPMDSFAFRLANRIVGNDAGAPGLEITITGPTLRFNTAAVITLTGAETDARLDGNPVPFWKALRVEAGSVLRVGKVSGAGVRTYLTVAGGIHVPEYLGSRATFTLGEFGGHAGRALRIGDVLRISSCISGTSADIDPALIPAYSSEWTIRVLYGPHGAPDFFTDEDIDTIFSHSWEVHHNSNRTGVRLIGPRPQWARRDGGEAGLHPSNIHDNAYAIGAIDFTGDMPILLGPDGPSLGGFVCPACIIAAEVWKMGQLKAGDNVRFVRVTTHEAEAAEAEQLAEVDMLRKCSRQSRSKLRRETLPDAVIGLLPAEHVGVEVTYRRAGDKYLLVEYGSAVLDLNLRFRAHALMQWCERSGLPGIIDLTPGIRSLQIHYDSRVLSCRELLNALELAERALPGTDDIEVRSRIIHMPLCWDDENTRMAIQKYMTSVRADAPWCPSNIEFIRRINGLESVDQVREIVFDASYLVMGLGDVYLGAPVATPLDPRHRLVTTKYNPARTWTPQNAVGIGGAYLCIYGMEGPGGYQFVGRTVQVWNTYRQTENFAAGKRWLLDFFDQIRFYPVSQQELNAARDRFLYGQFKLDTEETVFRLRDYTHFLQENRSTITAFKRQQQQAFEEERERWARSGQTLVPEGLEHANVSEDNDTELNGEAVLSHVPGIVWKVLVEKGQRVTERDSLIVLETMKMEIPVTAPVSGTIVELRCAEGRSISAGQLLCVIEPHD
jgi:urea carboxylase